MSQSNYSAKTFSDKLIDLLKSQKFKKFVEETVNEDNDIDYNEVKKRFKRRKGKKTKGKKI